jgi:hypothetical protein
VQPQVLRQAVHHAAAVGAFDDSALEAAVGLTPVTASNVMYTSPKAGTQSYDLASFTRGKA